MKKSPLSTPSGSGGKQSYNWKSYDYKSRTGYSSVKSNNYECIPTNGSQNHNSDDFIPLNASTPVVEQKRHSCNWYGSGGSRNHRNTGSGGLHYRNNYHATPKSNFNNSYSPYKHSGKQFHEQKKGYQRDTRRQVDISRYIDMKSFLEDPWAELVEKLNELRQTSEKKSSKLTQSLPTAEVSIDSKLDPESKSGTEVDNLQYSQEPRNESSIYVSLGLDDTNISELSKQRSSIDLKLDNEQCSQESKNESLSSTNDTAYEDACLEDNINHACVAQAVVVQESI